MKKKLLSLLLATAMTAAVLTGCGASNESSQAQEPAENQETEAEEPATEEEDSANAESASDRKSVV